MLVVAAPGQASRTVSEAYTVPATGKLALTGHGYGHGHGMSQYGAQGAALQGLTYNQIVAFYYPGTTLGNATGIIRVLISADTDNDVRVLPASGLRVREVGTGATYTLPATAGIKTWRLRKTVSGATALDYDNGAWHVYQPGGKPLAGDAEFFRAGNLTLRVGGGTRDYRGALRLSSTNTVNVLGLDDYVKGVIPREMPASWQPAAVRAQAVAARTYAAFDRAAHPTRYYDTCDTTSCQVYGGVGDEDSREQRRRDAHRRQGAQLRRQARVHPVRLEQRWLALGRQPALPRREGRPVRRPQRQPDAHLDHHADQGAIQNAYPSLGTLKRVLVTQRDGHGDWYGRVERMTLDGSKADVTLTGDAFRSKFGLRSSWFRFGSGATTTPAPQPSTTPSTGSKANSPIYKRWKALGGASSIVGSPKGAEYSVAGGRARRVPARPDVLQEQASARASCSAGCSRPTPSAVARGSKLGFPKTRPLKSGKHGREVRARRDRRTQERQGAGHLPLSSLRCPVGGRR